MTTTIVQGYSTQAGTYTAPALPKTSYRRLLVVWVVAIGLVASGLVALAAGREKPPARYAVPNGTFSVAYPAEGSAYKVTLGDRGVIAELLTGDGGTMNLFSEPVNGRAPRQIATDLLNATFPDNKVAYEIPNAMVGYQPGYGMVADWWPQGANSSSSRQRIVVMVAVKNDLALVAGGVGPYHAFGPDFGSGKPSAVGLQLALDMGKYVNSFAWRGDPVS